MGKSGYCVLVIEDDPEMREVLVESLEDAGFEVIGAASGLEAMAVASSRNFDLVVSDVRMAGMDGLESLTRLKSSQPELRTIVITGFASRDSPARAIRLQVDDYLLKPFGLEDFLKSVQRVLESGSRKSFISVLSRRS